MNEENPTHIDFVKSNLVLDEEYNSNKVPVYLTRRPFTTTEWDMVFDLMRKGVEYTKVVEAMGIVKPYDFIDYEHMVTFIYKKQYDALIEASENWDEPYASGIKDILKRK